ncbi:peptidoglycan-binding protein [Streptomyces sp. A7024]|uniref:Peptidoglycan-binding protein n=1 Tax=Streptomyces coryli TaxID=1128680 RepID=A0A6G4TXI1_9ACTN|nr:peptidoglycan-binding protein [Streptomyces coryli]
MDDRRTVRRLQRVLSARYNQPLAVDGRFGPRTRRALRAAQAWELEVRGRELTPDGLLRAGSCQTRRLRWSPWHRSSRSRSASTTTPGPRSSGAGRSDTYAARPASTATTGSSSSPRRASPDLP